MSDEWKPDDDDVEVYFALGATEYKVGEGGVSISEAHDAYRAWIAAHDRELRERIARDLMEKLPRILAETSGDDFGWLSDGFYRDAEADSTDSEADSTDSEVYVRDGSIDLDQIAEYAARIVGGK